jgi:tetratricopeptide (TPR) repeat protein
VLSSLRRSIASFASRRAAAASTPAAAERWHRVVCTLSPTLTASHRALVELLCARDQRWEARATAQVAAERFPENADAWILLGDGWQMVYRYPEALAAFEQALAIEERADAAMAAGALYMRVGHHAEAAARFARAYAAGGGPEALRRNAEALYRAGDESAAEQALRLWASQVPEGAERLAELRAEWREPRGGRSASGTPGA